MATLQKIKPYLWFDNQAKEAVEFYCTLFNNSKVNSVSDMIVEFELEGMKFIALNGGPQYKFTEAVSFMITCKNQAEVDHFWDSITSNGGKESMCGWCKDKYGLSWQVVPQRFMEMMETGSPKQVQQVVNVMMPMKRMIIEEFENAFRL